MVVNEKRLTNSDAGEVFSNKTYPTERGTLVVVENEKG